MDGLSDKTVFLCIAAYKDTQLLPTIINALEQAKNPKQLYIAVIEQDSVSHLQDIEEKIKEYGANLYYEYWTPEQSKGVCWARHRAQKYLNSSIHDYYLQTDSHARYILHYDSFLVHDYNHAKEYWGDFVWTAPPPDYEYDAVTGVTILQNDRPHTVSDGLLNDNHPSRIVSGVKKWNYNPYGEIANHISGAFMFGEAKVFIEHPYDPFLYWEGEESTYGARLYVSGIKTVSPPKIYTYHLYDDGSRGTRERPGDLRNNKLAGEGIKRCNNFWSGKVGAPYGVSSVIKLNEYLYNTGRGVYKNE